MSYTVVKMHWRTWIKNKDITVIIFDDLYSLNMHDPNFQNEVYMLCMNNNHPRDLNFKLELKCLDERINSVYWNWLYPEMNIPKELRSSVPDPLLSTIDSILGLTQLCRLSSPAALQVAWSCWREVGQYYIKSVENLKIAKHSLPPRIFSEPDLSKCTSFVTQFITKERYIHVWKQPSFKFQDFDHAENVFIFKKKKKKWAKTWNFPKLIPFY